MTIKGISLADWIYIITTLMGFIIAWLAKQPRLPASAQKYLKSLTASRLLAIVEAVAADVTASPEQRRAKAVELLQSAARKKLGQPLPDSIANLLVEYGYQLYKKAAARIAK